MMGMKYKTETAMFNALAKSLTMGLTFENKAIGLTPEAIETSRRIDKQRRAYRRMLKHYVQAKHVPPAPAIILDLGCGRCLEGVVLTEYFGKQHRTPIQLVGVDTDEERIEDARYLHRHEPAEQYEFICQDASRLRTRKRFDIIVARNPQTEGDPWQDILRNAYALARPGSLFIGTVYWAYEQKQLNKFLKNSGFRVVRSCENMCAAPSGHYDRGLTLARKSARSE